MKVFGIGLSRTGTRSLAAALNLLGIKTKWFPNDEKTWEDLVSANYRLRVLDDYDGITDTTACPYFPQFDVIYPGSRFILTTREKASWLHSCRGLWQNFEAPEKEDSPRKFGQWINCIVYGSHRFDEDRWSYVYDRHVKGVREYFTGRDNLLEMEIGDGWDALCPFLKAQKPEMEFPWIR